MAEFVLQIHDIDEAGKDYAFNLEKEWLNATLAEAGLRADAAENTGAIEVHAQKNDADYLVNGTIIAHLVTDCVRCLSEAKIPVDVHFASLYSRGSATEQAPASLEIDDEDDDGLQREAFSGHEIVLDDLVREHLVLEVPMQPLCTPDCKGIPVPAHVRPPEDVFGPSEGGIDPRLAPLMRLRDKVPPNKS